MNKELLLKAGVSVLAVFVMFGAGEYVARRLDRRAVEAYPAAPQDAEGFGDFPAFLAQMKELGRVQDTVAGIGVDYHPYTVTELKREFPFAIKNIDYTTNELGFRHGELTVPKPAGTFRVFMLGGSTVEGGFNRDWMISSYLEQALRAQRPNVEVVNAGVVGYMSQGELALLTTKIIDLEPDLVVIFDGRNDAYYSILPGWQARAGQDYAAEKAILDTLVNRPSVPSLAAYTTKALVRQSALMKRLFRAVFRQGTASVYPPEARIREEAIETYLGNLRMMKAVLEARGIRGLIVFQPTLGYCKDATTPYERSIIAYLGDVEGTDWLAEAARTWGAIGTRVDAIPDSALVKAKDFSCLFRDVAQTAYVDSVHYTPLSSQLIGDALAREIIASFP